MNVSNPLINAFSDLSVEDKVRKLFGYDKWKLVVMIQYSLFFISGNLVVLETHFIINKNLTTFCSATTKKDSEFAPKIIIPDIVKWAEDFEAKFGPLCGKKQHRKT